MTEDEMVRWHPRLSAHESEQVLGDGEGRGSLACCSPRGHEELDMTERLNNSNNLFCYCNINLKEATKCLQVIVCKCTHSLDLYVFLYKRDHATSLSLQLIL